MPRFRNIEIEFVLPSASRSLPEFEPPSKTASTSPDSCSNASTLDPSIDAAHPALLQGNTATVYIPTYPQAAFWIKYQVHNPEPNFSYFMQCFLNGRLVQSWGFGSECNFKGKTMYTTWDKIEAGIVEKRAMCFGPEEPAMALETNERVIEIKVYRACAHEAIDEPIVSFHETEFNEKGFGSFFPERDDEEDEEFGEHSEERRALDQDGHELRSTEAREKGKGKGVASRGLEEGIRLVRTGHVKPSTSRRVDFTVEDVPTTGRYFRWLLKDRIDKPLASFVYYYRTWEEQLAEMGIYVPLVCPSPYKPVIDSPASHQQSSSSPKVDEDEDSFLWSPTEDIEHPDRFILNEPGRGLTVRHANVTPIKKQALTEKPLPSLPSTLDLDDISPILGGFKEATKGNNSSSRAPHLPPRTSSLQGRLSSPRGSRSGSSEDGIDLSDSPSSYEDQHRVLVSEFQGLVSRRSVEEVGTRHSFDGSDSKAYNLPVPPPIPLKDGQRSRSKGRNRFLFGPRSMGDTDNAFGARLAAQVRNPFQALIRKSDVETSSKPVLSSAEDEAASPEPSISSLERALSTDDDSPTPSPRRRRNRKESTRPSNSDESKHGSLPLPRKRPSTAERQAGVHTTAEGAVNQGLTPSLSFPRNPSRNDSASRTTHLNSWESSQTMRRSPSLLELDQLALHGDEALETDEDWEPAKRHGGYHLRLQLPIGWKQGTTKAGNIFFRNCVEQTISLNVPSGTLLPVKPYSENPEGWEIQFTGPRVWFRNVFTQERTWDWPEEAIIGGLGTLRPGWEGEISKDGRIIFVKCEGGVVEHSFIKPGNSRKFREAGPPQPVPEIPERFRSLITAETKPRIFSEEYATPVLARHCSGMTSTPVFPEFDVAERAQWVEDTSDFLVEHTAGDAWKSG